MRVEQFCRTVEDIARNYKTEYREGGVGEHDGDLWYFDCCGLIKAVIWGWCGDTRYSRGGVTFPAQGQSVNGLPDVGANDMFNKYCYDISTDFTNIQQGELVWMDGHIGVFIKEGIIIPIKNGRQVSESTSDFDNKVLLSDLGMNGERISNGKQIIHWTHHGKFKCVEYSTPEYKFKKGDNVILNGWLHETNSSEQCVGEYHDYVWTITDIKDGEYPYQLNNVGWCREKYLTPYASDDFKQKYEKEALTSKDLEKQVNNLQGKINKAMEDLK